MTLRPNFLVECDYSGLEHVIVVLLSRDPIGLQWLQEGRDPHNELGSIVFGIPANKVNGEQREVMKTVRYGRQYGAGLKKIHKSLCLRFENTPLTTAKRAVNGFDRTHTGILTFQKELLRIAAEDGYVEDPITGRRIVFLGEPDVTLTLNFPIQAFGAGLMDPATLRIHERFKGTSSRLRGQIHDALIGEGPDIIHLTSTIKTEMERPITVRGYTHSFLVDTKIGFDWANMFEIKRWKGGKRGQLYEVKKLDFRGMYKECVLHIAAHLDKEWDECQQ